jgi:hypothetical protein
MSVLLVMVFALVLFGGEDLQEELQNDGRATIRFDLGIFILEPRSFSSCNS